MPLPPIGRKLIESVQPANILSRQQVRSKYMAIFWNPCTLHNARAMVCVCACVCGVCARASLMVTLPCTANTRRLINCSNVADR